MSRSARTPRALACLLAMSLAAPLEAGLVPRYVTRLGEAVEGLPACGVREIHELADGSLLIVSWHVSTAAGGCADKPGWIQVSMASPQGDASPGVALNLNGELLKVSVTPGGSIFTVARASPLPGSYEISTMRWNGRTGLPEWRSPARYPVAQYGLAFAEQDGSGNLIVATAIGGGAPTGSGWVTLGYSGVSGELLFPPATLFQNGLPTNLLIDPSGDPIVVGLRAYPPFWVAVRYAAGTDQPRWAQLLPAYENLLDAALDPRGDILVSGTTWPVSNQLRRVTTKLSGRTGAVLWGPVVMGGLGDAYDLSPGDSPFLTLEDGSVLLAHGAISWNAGHPDTSLLIAKLDGATGAALWGPIPVPGLTDRTSGFRLVREGSHLILVKDGKVLSISPADGSTLWGPTSYSGGDVMAVAGSADGSGRIPIAFGGGTRTSVLRLEASSGILMGPETVIEGRRAADGSATSLASAPGALFPCGRLDASDRTSLSRMEPQSGAVVWGPVQLGREPCASVADSEGNVLVVAAPESYVSDAVQASKVSGVDGTRLWGPLPLSGLYDGSVAIDRNDDLIVLDRGRWKLEKVDGATGAVLWGPVEYSDHAASIPTGFAVNPAGDVYLAGPRYGAGPGHDLAVLKYAGLDGQRLWGPVTIPNAVGQTLIVAPNGDAIVLARRGAPYLARLASADGGLVWALEPPALPVAFDTRLDAAGDVFVAGFLAAGADEVLQLALLKVAGDTGLPLWGPFASPLSGVETTLRKSLAVSSDGDPVVVVELGLGRTESGLLATRRDGQSGVLLDPPLAFPLHGKGSTSLEALCLVDADPVVAGSVDGLFAVSRLSRDLALLASLQRLEGAFRGVPYRVRLQVQNGSHPIRFEASSGLPPGLTLDPATGDLAGVPAASGVYNFVVTVSDRAGAQAVGTLQMAVARIDAPGLRGDLDLDSARDVMDVIELMNYVVGNLPGGVWPFLAPTSVADVNGDSLSDVFDVVLLMGFIVGNGS